MQPVSTGTEKNLLYREWVESNRRYVEKVERRPPRLRAHERHVRGRACVGSTWISTPTIASKDGVVIDVRNNNGGFVNVYAIDVLARRGYMNMTPRGLPLAPARTMLGQRALERPTILVTNQHSLSDAEDFTEGYRTLKLGKVVGRTDVGLDHLHRQRDADRRLDDAHARHAHHHAGRRDDGAQPAAG